jgi:hypothetical protein
MLRLCQFLMLWQQHYSKQQQPQLKMCRSAASTLALSLGIRLGDHLYRSQPGRSFSCRHCLRRELAALLRVLLLLLLSLPVAALACCFDLNRATSAAASDSCCQSMPWSNSLQQGTDKGASKKESKEEA